MQCGFLEQRNASAADDDGTRLHYQICVPLIQNDIYQKASSYLKFVLWLPSRLGTLTETDFSSTLSDPRRLWSTDAGLKSYLETQRSTLQGVLARQKKIKKSREQFLVCLVASRSWTLNRVSTIGRTGSKLRGGAQPFHPKNEDPPHPFVETNLT
jgi:hypothetical protein